MKLLSKTLLAICVCVTASTAHAVDNKKAGECIVVASVINDKAALKRALELADNPRIAMAEANNLIDFLKRTPQSQREFIFSSYARSCARIGIRITQ